jgi:signal transduction histidine kinase
MSFHIAALVTTTPLRDALVDALRRIVGDALQIHGYASEQEMRTALAAMPGRTVALVIIEDAPPALPGVDLVIALHGERDLRPARKVLLTDSTPLDELGRALSARALAGTVALRWDEAELRDTVHLLLTEFYLEHAPEDIEEIAGIVDAELLSTAFSDTERRLQRADAQLVELQRSFFTDRMLDDNEVEARMIAEIDRVLIDPDRDHFPPGTVLLREGQAVDSIWIVTEGRVRLSKRIDDRELVFHSRTTGRIVGLLAVTRERPSYFECVTVTPVTAIRLSLDQLDQALRTSPILAVHFVTVLLRTMARRNTRSIELQVAIEQLSQEITAERDQLALALERLEAAQSRLVESEKMATLGQLAAGIGHELNNPIAAINRAAEFLGEDLTAVLSDAGDDPAFMEALQTALGAPPLSTREERNRRRELGLELGDDELARRLVRIGIADPEAAGRVLRGTKGPDREYRIARLERYHAIGESLRNIRTAAGRVAELVGGLRTYARGGEELVPDADIHAGLDETLLLLNHSLRNIEVVRDFGDIPPVTCYPGRLNQVWLNLIHNAIQAMEGAGTLTVRTGSPEPGSIEVTIADSGPGIAPDHLDQIFDMHFTTRGGRVDFGLGLGLRIAKDIVGQHAGSISVDTEPGRTEFRVTLPVGPPGHASTISGEDESP